MSHSLKASVAPSQPSIVRESTAADIKAAVRLASAATRTLLATSTAQRAALLRDLADAVEAQRARLIELADSETGLGVARLNGELDRTTYQMRGFADLLTSGVVDAVVDEPAVAGPPPSGHPRMTRIRVPIGPVAMFSASNFPFAFSVLGGDTISALAAGCPVVVKAHPAHPELSRQMAQIGQHTVKAHGLPSGVLQMVEGEGVEVGVSLVKAPEICAVAFTGSFQGGIALSKIAGERARPIPFYGELGSVNPVVVLEPALDSNSDALANTLAASICQGAGQFCTSPGIVLVPDDVRGRAFVTSLAQCLSKQTPHAMLTPTIRAGFERGVAAWQAHQQVTMCVPSAVSSAQTPQPYLAAVDAEAFLQSPELHHEVFGPAAIAVTVKSVAQAADVLSALGGSLTVTIWGVDSGENALSPSVRSLVDTACSIAGRVLFEGVPTGVAVTAMQMHGGPFPASTYPFATSVGYGAVDRFLRPVVLQDAPACLVKSDTSTLKPV